ncbi:hypothetical protein LzC2_17980 [Planctomycetes bacterium LzC2]|uniref:Uncharacterized protein n=1 Tax=Alienimonas chondri TaxID=2681879 RepID=A0ABX1VCS4_9PLAN|nr:hypothetical protein [Alienimonas chondri]
MLQRDLLEEHFCAKVLQQLHDPTDVPAGVADHDAVGGGQRRGLALRAEQRADFADGLAGFAAFQRQHDADQFVVAAFVQLIEGDVRDEVRRDAFVDVGDDQEPVAANQHVPALQQVAVEDVQRFRRGVLAVVKVIEGSGRNRAGVQRQAGELGEFPQHRLPGGVPKVKAHQVLTGRLFDSGDGRFRSILVSRGVGIDGQVGRSFPGFVRPHRRTTEVDRAGRPFGNGGVEFTQGSDLSAGDPTGGASAPASVAATGTELVLRLLADLLLVALPLLVRQLGEHLLLQLLLKLRIAKLPPVAGLADFLKRLVPNLPHLLPLFVGEVQRFGRVVAVDQSRRAAGTELQLLVPLPLFVGEDLRGLLLELLLGGAEHLAHFFANLLPLLVRRGVAEHLPDRFAVDALAGGLA